MDKIKVICVDNTVDCSSVTNDLILDKVYEIDDNDGKYYLINGVWYLHSGFKNALDEFNRLLKEYISITLEEAQEANNHNLSEHQINFVKNEAFVKINDFYQKEGIEFAINFMKIRFNLIK